ncbi:MAG TPA: DNA-processing protein DprA [Sphingobacteriaceae bacterium]
MMLDTIQILTLLSTPGIGRVTIQQVISTLKSNVLDSRDLYDVLVEAKAQSARIKKVPSQDELKRAFLKAQAILEDAHKSETRVISFYDKDFPKQLRLIPDHPVLLYVKGDERALTRDPSIAIIGTREPTDYGSTMARRCGQLFSEEGFVVVSGLALGCDTAAHEGALAVHGRAVAVLAHGLNMIYPSKNKQLAQEILSKGGCLVSEYAPQEKPRKSYFVERDRIQSGLSKAVVVIETDISGGTMHTVRSCIEQKKPVGCLVHPEKYATHPKSNGNRYLLREKGAIGLFSSGDVDAFIATIAPSLHIPSSFDQESGNTIKQLSFTDWVGV